MDDKWFKAQQKKVGVTAEDIARAMGRSRSNVSHILNGHQRMSLDWAKAFSEVLQVPIATILEKAGVTDIPTARQVVTDQSDSDAAPWMQVGSEDRQVQSVAAALGQRQGVDLWQVKSQALSLMGYLPGDFILLDTLAAERARPGDVVVARLYDNAKGAATQVLRRFEPPVLVAASVSPDERRVHIVDGVNVVIRGKVIASWRK